MDIREKSQSDNNINLKSQEQKIDTIIFNLMKRNQKLAEMQDLYMKKYYQQPNIPIFNIHVYSYNPLIYIACASTFHVLALQKFKIRFIHILLHICIGLSLNQISKKSNIQDTFPQKWKQYQYFKKSYQSALESKVECFSMLQFFMNYLRDKVTKNKLNYMLSFKPF